MAGYQFVLDYRTRFTSSTITLANVDLITNSGKRKPIHTRKDFPIPIIFFGSVEGILVLQHLARVTRNLDIGAEILYQASPMMPGKHIGITSFVARYQGT